MGFQDLAAISLGGGFPSGAEERGARLSLGRMLVTQRLDPLRQRSTLTYLLLSHHEHELAHHVSSSIVNTTLLPAFQIL